MKKWKKLKTDRVFNHKYFKVNKDLVELPDGRQIDWLYWDSKDSAMVVPITSDNKLVMIRQYRYLPDKLALEFPSGHGDENESVEACAKRELEEETGYGCEELIPLGAFFETMGQLNRKIHIFLGINATKLDKPTRKTDENEQIKTALIELDKVAEMVADGEIISMGSSLAVLLAQRYIDKHYA